MLQALACTPGVRVALLRWAKQDNLKFRTPVRSSEVLPPEIHPLDEDELWPFATWALAAQVASKFVSQFRCPLEGVFLEGLQNQARQLGADQ